MGTSTKACARMWSWTTLEVGSGDWLTICLLIPYTIKRKTEGFVEECSHLRKHFLIEVSVYT